MSKKVWGPKLWYIIHNIAYNSPKINIYENYYKYFYNIIITNIIPCNICASHYKKNLDKINIDLYLNSKTNLIQWSILMHNEVNKSNGKNIYSFDEGMKMIVNGQGPIKCTEEFENPKSNNQCKSNNHILIIFLVLIIILLLVYIYKRNLT